MDKDHNQQLMIDVSHVGEAMIEKIANMEAAK